MDGGDTHEAGRGIGETGGSVLVVGDVPTASHRTFGRSVLGAAGDRRRLLVLAGRDLDEVDRYLPPGASREPERLRVVEHDLTTRSAATDGGGGGCLGDSVVVTVPGEDLPGLGASISEAVDAFDAIAGGLDPGELRVCFDSLGAVVAEHGETDAFGFLHILTERLGRADAVAAYHLPAPADDSTVKMLGSLFDAVVELRIDGERVEHRWDPGDGPGEWRQLDES